MIEAFARYETRIKLSQSDDACSVFTLQDCLQGLDLDRVFYANRLYWHCSCSMLSRVYADLSGVRPSVYPSKFAAVARPTRNSDRLLHGAQVRGVRQADAGSAALSVSVRSC